VNHRGRYHSPNKVANMASLCRIWRGDFAVQISLYFVVGVFKNRRRGFPEAMAAARVRSEPHVTSIGLASILISLGFNEEARRPAIARPRYSVAGDLLERGRWPFTMSIFS
jgi:hypothetical protein